MVKFYTGILARYWSGSLAEGTAVDGLKPGSYGLLISKVYPLEYCSFILTTDGRSIPLSKNRKITHMASLQYEVENGHLIPKSIPPQVESAMREQFRTMAKETLKKHEVQSKNRKGR